MLDFKSFRKQLYEINNEKFYDLVFQAFHFQAKNNPVYKDYLDKLGINSNSISEIEQIPFLPISFFKTHEVKSGSWAPEEFFESSGTTGSVNSKHLVDDIEFYCSHSLKNFEYFYGDCSKYHILALLPSYLERGNSSLVHMIQHIMSKSNSEKSGYYLYNYEELGAKLNEIKASSPDGRKTLVIGITFALLELAMQTVLQLSDDTIVMETGGMKGRGKELIRQELHSILTAQWRLSRIHSEYGMTELLSQAYSPGDGKFKTPPWMKVLTREITDPFGYTSGFGGINVIDLANIHSCVFIETQDIGLVNSDGTFEVIGRFDHSDIRGCNLLLS